MRSRLPCARCRSTPRWSSGRRAQRRLESAPFDERPILELVTRKVARGAAPPARRPVHRRPSWPSSTTPARAGSRMSRSASPPTPRSRGTCGSSATPPSAATCATPSTTPAGGGEPVDAHAVEPEPRVQVLRAPRQRSSKTAVPHGSAPCAGDRILDRAEVRDDRSPPAGSAVVVLVAAGAADHDLVLLDRDLDGPVPGPVLGVDGVVLRRRGRATARSPPRRGRTSPRAGRRRACARGCARARPRARFGRARFVSSSSASCLGGLARGLLGGLGLLLGALRPPRPRARRRSPRRRRAQVDVVGRRSPSGRPRRRARARARA